MMPKAYTMDGYLRRCRTACIGSLVACVVVLPTTYIYSPDLVWFGVGCLFVAVANFSMWMRVRRRLDAMGTEGRREMARIKAHRSIVTYLGAAVFCAFSASWYFLGSDYAEQLRVLLGGVFAALAVWFLVRGSMILTSCSSVRRQLRDP